MLISYLCDMLSPCERILFKTTRKLSKLQLQNETKHGVIRAVGIAAVNKRCVLCKIMNMLLFCVQNDSFCGK